MPYQYRTVTLPERGDKPYDQILLPAMHWLIDQALDRRAPSGFIFPTQVSALDSGTSIVGIVKPDTYSISEFTTSSSRVRFEVVVHNGSSAYMPSPTANGIPFQVTPYQGEWKGTVDLDIGGLEHVTFDNGFGVIWNVTVRTMSKPVIAAFSFSGGYPGVQTELKQGDTYGFRISSSGAIKSVEFSDFGASGATVIQAGNVSEYIGVVTAPNRGISRIKAGVRVRIQNAFDTWSDWLTVNGDLDGVDCVYLNNIKPGLTLSITSYPNGQAALKGSESASISLSASEYDSITFGSPNGDLDTSGGSVGQFSVSRIAGSYNISTPNLAVTAVRFANGTQTVATVVVKIANVAPVITVTSPSRMRSGVIAQTYPINLSSNQALAVAPSLSNAAGTGTMGAFTGAGTAWTAVYSVPDSATKGTFAWSGLQAVGLSGLVATTITTGQTYVIGGFTMRVISIPAWPARSAVIGTAVADVAKLKCTNLSKGTTGSYNFTYQPAIGNAPDRYTITAGNTWYNCDTANASSNTSSMSIEIEELA